MESEVFPSFPFFYFYSICFVILPKYFEIFNNAWLTDLTFFIFVTVIERERSSGHNEPDTLINLDVNDAKIWKIVSEKKGLLAKAFHEIKSIRTY